MRIPLDRGRKIPLYKQIYNYFKEQIATGKLRPGTVLPPSRELAKNLQVSRVTILRAYDELEVDNYIYRCQGKGTFVSEPINVQSSKFENGNEPEIWPLWQQELSHVHSSSLIMEYSALERIDHPNPISFIRGKPRLSEGTLFSIKNFQKHLVNLLRSDGINTLMPALFEEISHQNANLLQTIAEILTSQGIPTSPDEILITNGSQQAMNLVFRLLLRPGDIILAETPTYNLAIEICRSLGIFVVGVPMDNEGMRVELIEDLLKRYKPRLIYSTPTFHNPTGTCLSLERRKKLVDLAYLYNVPILEDDYVGDLRYEGQPMPTLKSFDRNNNVILISSFSKILGPGIRLGYLVTGGLVLSRLREAKVLQDLTTSVLLQQLINEFVSVGFYQILLRRLIREYRSRRDAMDRALRRYMPEGTEWYLPEGGIFLWLKLPDNLQGDQLLSFAIHNGVNFFPGNFFYANEGPRPNIRLNFIVNEPYQNEEGIKRLSDAIHHLKASRKDNQLEIS